MPYGTLTVTCGPMFAGKSSFMLQAIMTAKLIHKAEICVLSPAFDTRYGVSRITTHDGDWFESQAIKTWPDIPDSVETVFVDEIQFMAQPNFEGDVVASIQRELARGKEVIVSGLDSDWMGNPFPVTAQLLAIADNVTKLRSICAVCGEKNATKNYKKVANGAIVELGEADLYEARCSEHWELPRVSEAKAA